MFETKPVGRHHISVCTNISCMLCGGDEILAHVEKRLGIKVGESTPDGRFFLKQEEECLAACNGAPMMMVDHVYHENLTPEKVDEILDRTSKRECMTACDRRSAEPGLLRAARHASARGPSTTYRKIGGYEAWEQILAREDAARADHRGQ